MNRLLVADNDRISVWVYPERGIIHHYMKKYCYGPEFRDALMKGVDAMRTHRASKWLSDNRFNTGALPRDDEEWGDKVWFPAVKAAGWKHWSIVQPEKKISQINIERLIRKFADLGINTRMFSDPDQAMKWLEEC